MTLINDVCKLIAVRDDDATLGESRFDDFGSQLGAACHEKKHFAGERHLFPTVQNEFSNLLSNRGAARIGTPSHGVTLLPKPFGEKVTLGRFARAVEPVQR